MTRLEQLTEAKKIYDKLMKDGVYHPKVISTGFKLVHPDKPLPVGFAQRRQFMGYMQYMYDQELKKLQMENVVDELDELFEDDSLDFDNAEPTHEENFEIENQLELDLIPKALKEQKNKITVKPKAKAKRKYTKKK